MFALGNGVTALPTLARASSIAPAPVVSIAANGWEAVMAAPVDLALAPVALLRPGFDARGLATTLAATIRTGKRVRQRYPNQALASAASVALTDYVFAGETIIGVANNSTLASPKPFAAWVMPDRLTVGDSIPWEIKAYHYYGIACVWVRANDGTSTTPWQIVASQTLSTLCEDAQPVAAFRGDLNISSLGDVRAAWLEARVFPRFGTAILDSEVNFANGVDRREFTRRTFRRDTARVASPLRVYVASTGNDSTGVASTNDATAAASPCLTLWGAWVKLRVAGAVRGAMDNAQIFIVDSVNTGTTVFNSYFQDIGAVIVTRAPGSTRAAARLTVSAIFRPYLTDHSTAGDEGAIVFRDMTLALGGEFSLQGETGNRLFVQFHNCAIDMGSTVTTTLRANSHLAFFGCVATGSAAFKLLQQTASGAVRCMRGVIADTAANYEGWVTVGCRLTRALGPAFTDPSRDGHIWAETTFPNPGASATPLLFEGPQGGSAFDLGAFAMVNCLVERRSGSTPDVRVSSDGATGNITHGIIAHVTTPGTGLAGRWNVAYDEHASIPRQHRLLRIVGAVAPQFNVKGDVFMTDASRTGHMAVHHGVGAQGNHWRHYDASAASMVTGPSSLSFGLLYGGPGSAIGGGDPLFVDMKAVDGAPSTVTAGAGGGDYRLQGGSPARGIVVERLLPHDLSGSARPDGPQHAGAYL